MTDIDSLQRNIETLQDLNTFQFSLLKISQVIDLGLKGFDEQERLKNYLSDHDDDSAPSVLFNMSLYSLPYIYGHEDNDENNNESKQGGFIGFLKRMWTAILNFLKRLFPWFNKKSNVTEQHAEAVKKKFDTIKAKFANRKKGHSGVREYQYEKPMRDDDGNADAWHYRNINADVRDNHLQTATDARKVRDTFESVDNIDDVLKAAPNDITVLSNMPEWIAKASEITASIIKNKDSDINNLAKSSYDELKDIRLEQNLPINTLTSEQISKLLDTIVSFMDQVHSLTSNIGQYIADVTNKISRLNMDQTLTGVDNKTERAKLIEYRKGVTYLANSIKELLIGVNHILDSINKNIIVYLDDTDDYYDPNKDYSTKTTTTTVTYG